jgi:hypothetical protein
MLILSDKFELRLRNDHATIAAPGFLASTALLQKKFIPKSSYTTANLAMARQLSSAGRHA